MRICLGALVPGGACSLGDPFIVTGVRDGARKLDTGNGAESIVFLDSSGPVTTEAGALRIPEWLMQCQQASTGRSKLPVITSSSTTAANGLDSSSAAVSSIAMSSIDMPSIGMQCAAIS